MDESNQATACRGLQLRWGALVSPLAGAVLAAALAACGGGASDAPAAAIPATSTASLLSPLLSLRSGGGGAATGPLLLHSTYLGGGGDEMLGGVAVDTAGNTYITGTTTSTDFPAHGNDDVFVSKFDAAGRLVYSTMIGTPCADSASGIAVDSAGNAYVTGRAWEGWCSADTPVPDYPGVFVAKLDPAGAQAYFFFFGPATFDSSHGRAIAVDAAGQATITGVTDAWSPGFPTTPSAYRSAPCSSGGADGFVAKVNAAGTGLVYSTFLCGGGHDSPNAIALDADGNAYVAGSTDSADFPVINAFQPDHPAAPYGTSGFVAKLDASGSTLLYSTYLGGSEATAVQGIAVDARGQAYVTGYTTATDFPTTAGVVQPAPGSRICLNGLCSDAFVSKLTANGSGLVYSTYLAGEFHDEGVGIAVNAGGDVYVIGTTSSSTFPIVNAIVHRKPDHFGDDAFVTRLNASASAFVYSSYLGGDVVEDRMLEGHEQGLAIAVHGNGGAIVGGTTSSPNFPTTAGAFQTALAAGECGVLGYVCSDVFVTKLAASGHGVTPATSVRVNATSPRAGSTLTANWAGLASPSAEDELRLYRIGSTYHEFVASWPTTGAAGGSISLQLPGDATGWYDIRLVNLDRSGSLVTVARSDAFRIVAIE